MSTETPKNAFKIDFLRIGNSWMVGENVARIVPIYILHNVVSGVFKADQRVKLIKDLTKDPEYAFKSGLQTDFKGATNEQIKTLASGILSPDRRIFANTKGGGAHEQGALFLLLGGFAQNQASDDGLGKRLRAALDEHDSTWRNRIISLFEPEGETDAATNLARTLVQGAKARTDEGSVANDKNILLTYDTELCEFVSNLMTPVQDASRIDSIRNLAIGTYFASVLRLVNGHYRQEQNKKRYVFVYGGLPPGDLNNPMVQCASLSMSQWIENSWYELCDVISDKIEKEETVTSLSEVDQLRQKVKLLLLDQVKHRNIKNDDKLNQFLDELLLFDTDKSTNVWIRNLLSSEQFQFSKSNFKFKIRNLATTIGFAAPDRGVGDPRLVLDTPLLFVLVRGILKTSQGSMNYKTFVTELAQKLGLVVGLGMDDSIADKLEIQGANGWDIFEILEKNEEQLRQRLLRVGLARSYSDSHTEVLIHG
jgi:hypothetical protein